MDNKTRVNPEFIVGITEKEALGEAEKVAFTLQTTGNGKGLYSATEIVGVNWNEIASGFLQDFDFNRPSAPLSVHKRYDIDHTKRGREQEASFNLGSLFTNMEDSGMKFNQAGRSYYIRFRVNPDGEVNGAGDPVITENIYLGGVVFTDSPIAAPVDGISTCNMTGIYAKLGYAHV